MNGDGAINSFDINVFINMVTQILPHSRRYVYDEENRLTAVTDIDDVALFEIDYDALGRRIETRDYADDSDPCDMGDTMVTTRHAYAGLNTIEEYVWCDIDQDEATEPTEWFVAREFLWGDRFPEPLMMVDHTDAGDGAAGTAEVLHYVRDALGSVVGLVDAGDPDATPDAIPAKLVERYDYDPYGKTYVEYWDATGGTGGEGAWVRTADAASHFGNPFMWTSQRYDRTVGLYHFPFRSYSPELGRWMQRDPLGYVDGVNVYEYVGSMPTAFGDPTGLTSVAPGTTPGWDPMNPDGWHPPMIPPDDGEYGPDGMGPPAPPLPGPCGDGSGDGGSGVGPDGGGAGAGGSGEPQTIEEAVALIKLLLGISDFREPDGWDLAQYLDFIQRLYDDFNAGIPKITPRIEVHVNTGGALPSDGHVWIDVFVDGVRVGGGFWPSGGVGRIGFVTGEDFPGHWRDDTWSEVVIPDETFIIPVTVQQARRAKVGMAVRKSPPWKIAQVYNKKNTCVDATVSVMRSAGLPVTDAYKPWGIGEPEGLAAYLRRVEQTGWRNWDPPSGRRGTGGRHIRGPGNDPIWVEP